MSRPHPARLRDDIETPIYLDINCDTYVIMYPLGMKHYNFVRWKGGGREQLKIVTLIE